MNQYLYVCHFSNGLIKVGRSIDPVSRIAQHAERVSCMGVELIEHQTFLCVGHVIPAEAALIKQCEALAVSKHKNEWFGGLDYLWACHCASSYANTFFEFIEPEKQGFNENAKAALDDPAIRAQLAKLFGVSTNVINHWRRRGIPADKCPDIEQATGIKCEVLRPDVNWAILRVKPEATA